VEVLNEMMQQKNETIFENEDNGSIYIEDDIKESVMAVQKQNSRE
jgi:hypothetical protein